MILDIDMVLIEAVAESKEQYLVAALIGSTEIYIQDGKYTIGASESPKILVNRFLDP